MSLGILPRPLELLTLPAAVVALLALGLVINRLAGIPHPLGNPPPLDGQKRGARSRTG